MGADRSDRGAAGSQPSAPAVTAFGEQLRALETHLAARVFAAEGGRGAVRVAVDGHARIHAITLDPDWTRAIQARALDTEVARLYRSASRDAVAAAESLYTPRAGSLNPPAQSTAAGAEVAVAPGAPDAGPSDAATRDARDASARDASAAADAGLIDLGEDPYGEEPDLPDLGMDLTDQDFLDLATAGLGYADRYLVDPTDEAPYDTGSHGAGSHDANPGDADLHDAGMHAAAMGGLPAASEIGRLVDFPWVAEAVPALRHVMAKLAAETVRTGDVRTGVAVEFTCEGELIDIEVRSRHATETAEGQLAQELVAALREGEEAAARRRGELAAEITGDRPIEEVAQEQLAQLRHRMDELRKRLP
ncbi:YbaB/EbfC family nucleoid-associated protein [Actinopolymorpha sp. B11F2]|uniref:YbaB/EbfC family nucleoid-associated protein n=1 Tax=Actinopolymorpha sp. B11F2 TaxID=3160862 RepID=UPI0032E40036